MVCGSRAFLIVALSSMVIVATSCTHNSDKNAGKTPVEKTSTSAAPSVGPGNTPKVGTGAAAADIKGFWFDSPYAPTGKRVWTRVGPDKWDETAADGTVSHYVGSDHYDMGGYHGVVVRGGPDDLNILIPDGGKGQMLRFREAAGGRNWSNIATIDGVE